MGFSGKQCRRARIHKESEGLRHQIYCLRTTINRKELIQSPDTLVPGLPGRTRNGTANPQAFAPSRPCARGEFSTGTALEGVTEWAAERKFARRRAGRPGSARAQPLRSRPRVSRPRLLPDEPLLDAAGPPGRRSRQRPRAPTHQAPRREAERVRRPVSRVLSSPCGDGWPFLWDARCRAPRATDPGGDAETPLPVARRATPIWSCSRWGLPCRFRCRSRGGLLPHRFTLA